MPAVKCRAVATDVSRAVATKINGTWNVELSADARDTWSTELWAFAKAVANGTLSRC